MSKENIYIEEIALAGYEKVLKIEDPSVNLKGIICIHNTALGPALGGTRIYPYPTFDAALEDVMRLAQGMTYKSALAGTGLGGGKSVIISDSKNKSKELLLSFAQVLNRLEGEYTCAEDVGCTLEDVTFLSQHTPYVTGIRHEKSSGNPSPFTAWGTLRGIQSVLKALDRSDSLRGKKIAIQGLGSVGAVLAELLFWQGAELILSDLDWDKTLYLAKKFHAVPCPSHQITQVPCDVFAPCALGGILNPQTIPSLHCRAIAGCANNQLLTQEDGEALKKRNILYAPDFIVNAGGLINVAAEVTQEGYNPAYSRDKIHQIYDLLLEIYALAEKHNTSTHTAAVTLGDSYLSKGIGKRTTPLCYHHANPPLPPRG